jgi:hypothetical protein
VCGYTGPQFRGADNLSGPDDDDGAGVTVAVVDSYISPTLFSDAHQFAVINDPGHPLRASQFSELPANTFNHGGPNQCDPSGRFGEQTLDRRPTPGYDNMTGLGLLSRGS